MNRTLCIFLFGLILSITRTLGQHKLSVSATLAPTFSHTVYKYRYFYPESDGQIVEPVYINGPRWSTGYTAGLSFIDNYAPGWSFSSGLWYQQVSVRQARQPTAGEGTVALHKRVLRIPMLLNYSSSTRRLSPYFSLGLFTDFPITSRVVVNRTSESTQYLRLTSSARPIFSGMLGAGLRYKLTNRYTILTQPVWAYSFGQIGSASSNDTTFELSVLTQFAYSF